MNIKDLLAKYKHQLILKNYSSNTVDAYLNGLKLFLAYIKKNELTDIDGKKIATLFYLQKYSTF